MTERATPLNDAPVRARRFKMFHLAEMRVLDARVKVHVVNLSTSGLMFRTDAAPEVGTVAIFDLGSAERRGRIVWRDADRCGVQFMVPLTEAELQTLMAPSVATASPVRSAFDRLAARFSPPAA